MTWPNVSGNKGHSNDKYELARCLFFFTFHIEDEKVWVELQVHILTIKQRSGKKPILNV